MRFRKAIRMGACSILLLGTSAPGQEKSAGFALKGLDPVDLVSGQEVPGVPQFNAEFGKYRYTFRTAQNLAEFRKDPERYAVQFGGACMRMGPLSGGGNSDRFLVHAGRIYLFASDACQKTFQSNPARFIDVPDPEPESSPESAKSAADILTRAVQAIGGPDALQNLKTLEVRQTITQKGRNGTTRLTRISATSFPETFARMDDYGDYKGGWTLLPEHGYLSWEKGVPVDPSVRQFMLREFYRLPLHLLKAWQDGKVKAVTTDAHRVAGAETENVVLFIHGAATQLSVDRTTGLIVRASFRSRTPAGIADIARTFDDYRSVGGLQIPWTAETLVDGVPQQDTEVTVESVRVNEPLDPALTAVPR